jgi:voltage-gated potassium channel
MGIIALLAIVIVGIIGYSFIEGWPFIDSLYMTIITLSTVGYREVYALSDGGRIFTIFLIILGVGVVFYLLTNLVGYILEGELGLRIGRRRMENRISKLRNHFIICGYGRVGEAVAKSLKEEGSDFVTIEIKEDAYNRALKSNYLAILGDATRNETLLEAGINHARGLIVALGDDAHSLYTIMSAKELYPDIFIVCRANNEDAAKRMQASGAKHVIAPEFIGGQRMARLAVRPAAVQFIETMLSSKGEQLIIEELKANDDAKVIGLTVKELEEMYPRLKVLAIRENEGSLILGPAPGTIIKSTHNLTVFGPLEQLEQIESCCQSRN